MGAGEQVRRIVTAALHANCTTDDSKRCQECVDLAAVKAEVTRLGGENQELRADLRYSEAVAEGLRVKVAQVEAESDKLEAELEAESRKLRVKIAELYAR